MFDAIKQGLGDAMDDAKQKAIADAIEATGVSVSGLSLSYDDGEVTVRGGVSSAADGEKIINAIKGVGGIAKIKDGLSVGGSASGGGGKSYTVVSGDTLSGIAQKFYGDANQYMKIYEANKATIGGSPDHIQVGQHLIIP
ncbi:MAG: LysM peptidoglycan-binding domain-containing protein [Cytophagales bacterium]|nr:MAG: LysM peptidoglycan-binding domain-containing protein [Cytophagales bacterium]